MVLEPNHIKNIWESTFKICSLVKIEQVFCKNHLVGSTDWPKFGESLDPITSLFQRWEFLGFPLVLSAFSRAISPRPFLGGPRGGYHNPLMDGSEIRSLHSSVEGGW